jgi:hypothetical protein
MALTHLKPSIYTEGCTIPFVLNPNGVALLRTFSVRDNHWRVVHYWLPDAIEWRVTQVGRRPSYSRQFARCYRNRRRYGVFFYHPRCLSRPIEYDHGDYPGRPDPERTLIDYPYDDDPPF